MSKNLFKFKLINKFKLKFKLVLSFIIEKFDHLIFSKSF